MTGDNFINILKTVFLTNVCKCFKNIWRNQVTFNITYLADVTNSTVKDIAEAGKRLLLFSALIKIGFIRYVKMIQERFV